MQIHNIDLIGNNLSNYQDIVKKCKEIINENLQTNGGTLKVSDIFERDFNWANLIIAVINNEIIGFALIRQSNNTHNLKESDFYYYLSDIVVKKDFRNLGIGKELMKKVIESRSDAPLVASVLKDNQASIGLLSKFMKCYGVSMTGRYLRFVDNKYYNQLYGNTENESLEPYAPSKKSR